MVLRPTRVWKNAAPVKVDEDALLDVLTDPALTARERFARQAELRFALSAR